MYKIHIKNMVCPRCVDSVCDLLTDMNLTYYSVKLGEVELKEIIQTKERKKLSRELKKRGFEYIVDKEIELINQVKSYIIEKIHYAKNNEGKFNISDELSKLLRKDYSSISRLFSKNEKITIEQFIKLQKTERVKELISYNQLNLSEIAYSVGYSSIAHLSNQFKSVTGMSPSEFKKLNDKFRNTIDSI